MSGVLHCADYGLGDGIYLARIATDRKVSQFGNGRFGRCNETIDRGLADTMETIFVGHYPDE